MDKEKEKKVDELLGMLGHKAPKSRLAATAARERIDSRALKNAEAVKPNKVVKAGVKADLSVNKIGHKINSNHTLPLRTSVVEAKKNIDRERNYYDRKKQNALYPDTMPRAVTQGNATPLKKVTVNSKKTLTYTKV